MNMLDLFDDDMESESEMLKKKKKVRLLYLMLVLCTVNLATRICHGHVEGVVFDGLSNDHFV